MKVKCQLCGTKFDLELNHNVCPECAAYYRVDGVSGADSNNTHMELREAYDTNSDNTIYDEEKYDHSEIHSMYDQNSVHTMYSNDENCGANFDEKTRIDKKTKKPLSTTKKVIIAIEIIALIFCIIWPFVGIHTSKKKLESQRVTEKPSAVPKMIDEKIPVGDYTIQISDYYIDKKEYWNLPDNYVVYAVSYKIEHDGATYTSLYNAVQPYMETPEGLTIIPLESYEAKEYMTEDRYKTMEKKVGGYIKNDGGILYFVLKEDEKIYGLGFDVYECDQDDYNYKEMDTTYLMYLPELEVE